MSTEPNNCMRVLRQLAATLTVVTILTPTSVASTDESVQRARLEAIRERIGNLQSRMQSTEDQRSTLSKQLQVTEQQIGTLVARLRDIEERLARRERSLRALRARESTQRKRLSAQRNRLSRQLRAAYAMGQQERLKLLLNQQEPTQVGRMLTYYNYFNRARSRGIAQTERVLNDLQATQRQISDDEQRLNRLKASELAQRDLLQQQQRARRGVLAALANDLQEQSAALVHLKQDEQRLATLLSGIRQVLADIPDAIPADQPFEKRRGRMSWPTAGRITRAFGTRRVGGQRWDGVIIEGPEGQVVRAVHRGRVAYADWLRGFGLLLIIDHGDGWMSLYGHNQSLFKEAGDWVESGEPIASLGVSGGRTVPGIYFGIRRDGKPVDPLLWCRRPHGRKVGCSQCRGIVKGNVAVVRLHGAVRDAA